MKKLFTITLAIAMLHSHIDAVAKTFVNNSSKDFLVRIYYGKNEIMGLVVAPGAIQDVFIPCDTIDKISVIDNKHRKKTLASMTHHELRKESSKINYRSIFIINQNSSINMYKASTSRDKALQEIDESFMQHAKVPMLEVVIHAIKDAQGWITQKVTYALKHKTSFLGSVESLIAQQK